MRRPRRTDLISRLTDERRVPATEQVFRSAAGLTGPAGPTGPTGATGAAGRDAGVVWAFDSSTSSDDPGAGEFRLNHATPGSATALYVSETDGDGAGVEGWLSFWDASSNPNATADVIARKVGDPATFVAFRVTGAVTDNGGWDSIPISVQASGGTFTAGDDFVFFAARAGNKGDTGATGATGATGPTHNKCARVYNSANISVSNATVTALTFNSERFDTDSIHSTASNTSRLTATTAGVYQITGHVRWASNATGSRLLYIRENGTAAISYEQIAASVNGEGIMDVTALWKLAAGEYVELVTWQNSGGALNVEAWNYYSPEFEMAMVGVG